MQTITEKFFGRLKTRRLTKQQTKLIATLLPQIRFEKCDSKIETFLEIGFGKGEHIVSLAEQNPNNIYIGCDPFINCVAALLCHIFQKQIGNIRIYDDDARKLMHILPSNSISGVFLMFPDPWPKRRHIERRFVNNSNIAKMHRILKADGIWRIATDHSEYAKHILKNFKLCENLFELAEIFSEENRPSEVEWPKTKYEEKTTSKSIMYVTYTKLP
jgi:tRNA (guanine-N7-)-methyltransferase